MNPQLSIIIVNYNGENILDQCFNSIKKFINCPHEIILVDNASSDNSLTLVKNKFPYVHVIENEINLGFATGNNIGVKNAEGDFLLLLNNDTQLTNSILPAIDLFKSNEEIGVLGGQLKYQNGKIQPSYGYFHTPIRIVFSWLSTNKNKWFPSALKRIETDISKYTEVKEVDWVSGAFLLTRKTLWEKINGMDERYFMYVEDVDFCKRANYIGYKTIYSNKISAVHYVRVRKPYIDFLSLIYTSKSYLIYIEKFHSRTWIISVKIGLCFVFLIRGFIYSVMNLLQIKNDNKRKVGIIYFKTAFLLLINKLKSTNA